MRADLNGWTRLRYILVDSSRFPRHDRRLNTSTFFVDQFDLTSSLSKLASGRLKRATPFSIQLNRRISFPSPAFLSLSTLTHRSSYHHCVTWLLRAFFSDLLAKKNKTEKMMTNHYDIGDAAAVVCTILLKYEADWYKSIPTHLVSSAAFVELAIHRNERDSTPRSRWYYVLPLGG